MFSIIARLVVIGALVVAIATLTSRAATELHEAAAREAHVSPADRVPLTPVYLQTSWGLYAVQCGTKVIDDRRCIVCVTGAGMPAMDCSSEPKQRYFDSTK